MRVTRMTIRDCKMCATCHCKMRAMCLGGRSLYNKEANKIINYLIKKGTVEVESL